MGTETHLGRALDTVKLSSGNWKGSEVTVGSRVEIPLERTRDETSSLCKERGERRNGGGS